MRYVLVVALAGVAFCTGAGFQLSTNFFQTPKSVPEVIVFSIVVLVAACLIARYLPEERVG